MEISIVNFIHLFDLPGTVAKNATVGPLAGIEPAALRFRCSALTNRATVSELYTWKADFSQWRNQKVKPKMADFEPFLRVILSPLTCAVKHFLYFHGGKWWVRDSRVVFFFILNIGSPMLWLPACARARHCIVVLYPKVVKCNQTNDTYTFKQSKILQISLQLR